MLKKVLVAGGVMVAAFSAIVFAIDTQKPTTVVPQAIANNGAAKNSASSAKLESIRTNLQERLGMKVNNIFETDLTGIVLLMTDRGMLYMSEDGNFVVQGSVYDLRGEQPVELSEASFSSIRLEGIERFKNDMIEYPAENEKHVVTVFTDITCGYCRKMHNEMKGYNDLGITVRYLAYPRHGIKDRNGEYSQGFKDLRSIWCNEDPAKAMTKAKGGQSVALRICDSPIEAEFNFGRQVGVNGTPAIVLPNGNMVPGYQKPEQLLERLENM